MPAPFDAPATRRTFAALAGAVAATAATTPVAAAASLHTSAERPNILWLVAEDHYPFVGAHGDPVARTPTLDRLAPWGQHGAFAWLARGYQSWQQAHLDGTLDPVQERFWDTKPAEELYDLHTDPDEVHNLAGTPAHARTLSRLSRALDDHIVAVHDNGFIPEGSRLEGWEQSRRPGAYPLRRVMRLARQAIDRDPRHLPTLVRALSDANEVLRYWAAQGLPMLGPSAAPALPHLLHTLRTDDSPHVRISAAETLIRHEHEAREAVGFLSRTLTEHADTRVRLQALNALACVDPDLARPALAAIETAATSKDEYLHNADRYLGFVLDGTYTPSSPVYEPVPAG